MKLKYNEFLTSLLPVPANVDDSDNDRYKNYDSERNKNEYV